MSGWIIETLIASTLLMLFVLALREPVSRHFGPRIAYALWLLPALRRGISVPQMAQARRPMWALQAGLVDAAGR